MTRIAIVYYSATGKNHEIAQAVEEGARSVGAETRLRKAAETATDAAIDQNPAWRAHVEAARDTPEAVLEDLEWADGFVFGSPTRFGGPASQLKQFLDATGGLWFQGKLANKPAAGFTSASYDHGGQESTLLALYNVFYHWGAIVVPMGYTDKAVAASGGNPYGVSFTDPRKAPLPDAKLAAARYLGRRVARFAQVLSHNAAALAEPAAG
jgi:NAD(P)H dehydrogenase (quinone)